MTGLDFTIQVRLGHVILAGHTLPVLAQIATDAEKAKGAKVTISIAFVATGPVRTSPTRIVVGLMLRALGELLTQASEMRAVWWALLGLERALDKAKARNC